jgi:hypothetical protein
MREFVDTVIIPEARLREEDGKRVSQEVLDKMAYVLLGVLGLLQLKFCVRAMEIHAMRLGPGKHLKGRTLMGGLVKPEEVRRAFGK